MDSSLFISSPSLGRWTYDVFLSFRGEDTRNNFVDHVYAALDRAGLYTFKDDQNLLRGKPISPELVRAIEESRVALVVFSKNYANSCWCLDELAKIIECQDLMGQRVLPVFYDVGPSDIRRQKGCFLAAFKQHGVHLMNNMDKVKRWREALETATNLSGWGVLRTVNRDHKIPHTLEDFVHSINTTKTKNKAKASQKNNEKKQMVTNLDVKDNNGVASQEVSVDNMKVEEMKNDVRDREELNGDTDGMNEECLGKESSGTKCGSSDSGGKGVVGNKKDMNKNVSDESNNRMSSGGIWNFSSNEEIIEIGCEKWKYTVYGFFVGGNVTYNEARYHLRRMWNKFGFIDIMKNDGVGMILDKAEPSKLPLCVKILNVPMEAWSVKEISALASSLGKPIIMDDMTAKICVKGEGRLSFARVLIEVDVGKELKKEIEVVYKGKENGNNKEKGIKDNGNQFTKVQKRRTFAAMENQNFRKWNGNNRLNVNRRYFGINNKYYNGSRNNGRWDYRRKQDNNIGNSNGGNNKGRENVSQEKKVDNSKGKSNENMNKGETSYNRFTLLDSLVGEEDLIPSVDKRKIVDEFMNNEKEEDDYRKQGWDKEMEKYYKDRKELFEAAKDLEQDEDVDSEILIEDEFGKRNGKSEGDRGILG
ncbi:TMV resistance protein N-like protein [Tanacetum coccineum]